MGIKLFLDRMLGKPTGGTPEDDYWAADAVERRAAERAAERVRRYTPEPVPPLTPIGRTDGRCPSCLTVMEPRLTAGKQSCGSCGKVVHSKRRPIDSAVVLVTDGELSLIEDEWKRDHEIKARSPRELSPEWQARLAEAKAAGSHADATVEGAAQAIMSEFFANPLGSPRDIEDAALARIADPVTREEVSRRLWQLKVQVMG